jgi:hypothetical protein
MEDKPVLICCDGIACHKKVMVLVKEWAEEEDKDMVGGTYRCLPVESTLLARTDMLKCSRCKSISTVPKLVRRSTGKREAIKRSVCQLVNPDWNGWKGLLKQK